MSLIFCESLHAQAQDAPDGIKHKITKLIGFTTDYLDASEKAIGKWEIDNHAASISFNKKTHFPKLPHNFPDGGPGNVNNYTVSVKVIPGQEYKVKKIEVTNNSSQTQNYDLNAGQEATIDAVIDVKTLENKENTDAIKVTILKNGEKMPSVYNIPLIRLDTFPETISLVGKKIMDEGHHENEVGSEYKKRNNLPHTERLLYFVPQGDAKISISCYGHVTHALRHASQKWFGPNYSNRTGPAKRVPVDTNQPEIVDEESILARAIGLRTNGWTIKFVTTGSSIPSSHSQVVTALGISGNDVILNCTSGTFPGTDGCLLVQDLGEHCATQIGANAQEAHYLAVGDAIYDRGTAASVFVGTSGYVFIPPQQ